MKALISKLILKFLVFTLKASFDSGKVELISFREVIFSGKVDKIDFERDIVKGNSGKITVYFRDRI